jgi:hypothetical protein
MVVSIYASSLHFSCVVIAVQLLYLFCLLHKLSTNWVVQCMKGRNTCMISMLHSALYRIWDSAENSGATHYLHAQECFARSLPALSIHGLVDVFVRPIPAEHSCCDSVCVRVTKPCTGGDQMGGDEPQAIPTSDQSRLQALKNADVMKWSSESTADGKQVYKPGARGIISAQISAVGAAKQKGAQSLIPMCT